MFTWFVLFCNIIPPGSCINTDNRFQPDLDCLVISLASTYFCTRVLINFVQNHTWKLNQIFITEKNVSKCRYFMKFYLRQSSNIYLLNKIFRIWDLKPVWNKNYKDSCFKYFETLITAVLTLYFQYNIFLFLMFVPIKN